MKTTTIFNAYLGVLEKRHKNKREWRQLIAFHAALLRRIEEGDRARTALQMAARAYYSADDEMLGYILKGEK